MKNGSDHFDIFILYAFIDPTIKYVKLNNKLYYEQSFYQFKYKIRPKYNKL